MHRRATRTRGAGGRSGSCPGLCARTSASVVRSTQVICKGLGPYFKPKHVGMLEAVPILFEGNAEFDQAKFLMVIADRKHWVTKNLALRLDSLCAMLAIISAGKPQTGLTLTLWGREVRTAVRPVLDARFTPLTGVPDALVLTGTGICAVSSPNHPSAGTATQGPTTKRAARPCPRTGTPARRCASESRTRACRADGWRRDDQSGHRPRARYYEGCNDTHRRGGAPRGSDPSGGGGRAIAGWCCALVPPTDRGLGRRGDACSNSQRCRAGNGPTDDHGRGAEERAQCVREG